MNTSLLGSHPRSFAAGFLAATILSGVALAVPGIRAQLGVPTVDPININQLLNFHGEWMEAYDLNKNGIPDFGERGMARDGHSYNLMFVSHDGDTVPDFCRLGDNWKICGTQPSIAAEQHYDMTPELCNDGLDNESDGFIDCNDAQCSRHASCMPTPAQNDSVKGPTKLPDDKMPAPSAVTMPGFSREICDDYNDNDGDGMYDSWDPDCSGSVSSFAAPDLLTEPLVAPSIPNYQADPAVVPIRPADFKAARGQQGSDGVRPAGPNFLDKYWPQDSAPPSYFDQIEQYSYVVCPNPFGNNDGDEDLNISDEDCFVSVPTGGSMSVPTIPTTIRPTMQNSSLHGAGGTEICNNRMDDNSNGFVDCSDTACASTPGREFCCDDNVDNDNDNYFDKEDSDC